MNVLVLMAGIGKRFSDKGYTTLKPLIEVNGKTILEWTTESCPYINRRSTKLYFAVLKEHIDIVCPYLISTYGDDINIVVIETLTRGNLETAYIASEHMDGNDSLLILDADNKYDHNDLPTFIKTLPADPSTMAIGYFDNPNPTLPNKWSNAKIKENKALGIKEKNDEWVNEPALIGMFYFKNTSHFRNKAEQILNRPDRVQGEYFMSMVPSFAIEEGLTVYAHEVTKVIPLGTPEDVAAYTKENKLIFAFDIDNTICERKLNGLTYETVKPFADAVNTIRWLKSEGHTIILHTGRHMKTCGGNMGKAWAKQGKILLDWLERHSIPYDEIWWSKPHADLFIDDAVHRHTDWPNSILAIKQRLLKGPRGPENP